MYQWRKFQFFEEKVPGTSVAEELKEKVVCCSSGRGRMVVGSEDGMVHVLDRGLKLNYSFQAHSGSVQFIQQLKQRNILVTIGEDETASPQLSAMCLKVFDLDKMQSEGSSTTGPTCIQILRIFTNQFPEAKITSFLVFEEAPPILMISIGLETGYIYCIKGDVARERIVRTKLEVEESSNGSRSPVTGLGFRVEGPALQLFVVTTTSVSLFDMHHQPPRRHVLDQIGCGSNSVSMSDNQELVIGRTEAVYFYEVDGRGPCWAFEGEKLFLGWFRGYLLSVIADQRTSRNVFNIYDLKNRLIAYSLPVGEVTHMLCEWGNIILLTRDHKVLCIGEKDMESKLDMLFKKNLYTVAINLVQSQQADAAATAEVLRKYADHLYSKQDYDEAMAQYIRTIGQLEPSYVIQKFLDAQRIYNLTSYLEKLHEKGLASKDHTTLLLNCYTKLKDVAKLDEFIKGEGEHRFDVETAVKVCRGAGYHEHAMYVAKKAGKHEWYLKILLEDLGSYDEALEYISSLETIQAAITVKEYGKILVEHKSDQTIAILMKLCTGDGGSATNVSDNLIPGKLPSPIDFINIFLDHPLYLMIFLEKYISKVKDSPSHVEIHNTLLELYLSDDLCAPSFSRSIVRSMDTSAVGSSRNIFGLPSSGNRGKDMNGKGHEPVDTDERTERLKKGLALLKSAWPSHEDHPRYDVDLAVVLSEQDFYKTTLKALEEAKNERLWFKTNLKLCKLWFNRGEYGRMNKTVKELHRSCQREDGTDDHKKGTQLLEVYAIEIQMYTETKNNKKLKQLYNKALTVKSAIPHPRIMGIIHECGGKMHTMERQWVEAATDFFEAFRNYDEAGNQRRIQCLKYLVLANMLMQSEVNPFDAREAKPYKNDPEILAMTNLIAAYQRNEILEFERILKSNRTTIMDDSFIRNHIEDLLKNIRTQVLLKLIKPYTRIRIPFVSKELNIPEKDVEQLLVSLILDSRIPGHIDQVNQLLELGDVRSKGLKKYQAIDKWNTQLHALYQTVAYKIG